METMESPCIRVPSKAGEETRRRLIECGALNKNLKIRIHEGYLSIPVLATVEGLGESGKDDFEILKNENSCFRIYAAYELIGDIAVIDYHEEDTFRIADLLLRHRNIKTVFQAIGAVSGEFRTRELLFIAGEKKSETLHKENGCRYLLDIAQVYFSPRLSTERMRIADMIAEGDLLVDMFAGVGPFSIPIAKRMPLSHVIAIDINPTAIKYLRENIRFNKVSNVEIKEGDAREAVRGIIDADHIIMNLPHSGLEFLNAALSIIRTGGIIHMYAITHQNDLFEGIIKEINEYAYHASRNLVPVNKRVVRPYAPYQYNICIDLQIFHR